MTTRSIPSLLLTALTVIGMYDWIDGGAPARPAPGSEAPVTVDHADHEVGAHLSRLAGCFAVHYQFVEDGRGDFFFEDGVEYMDIAAHGDGFLVRNYLILDEHTTFLHWTQEWTPLDGGEWMLTVKSGDDSLRYRSRGTWRFNQWEGQAALAAKPNRDILRRDYDVLERRNVLQFTDKRWIQSEVNMKLREDGTLVASEVGWIRYDRRASDEACAPALALARR